MNIKGKLVIILTLTLAAAQPAMASETKCGGSYGTRNGMVCYGDQSGSISFGQKKIEMSVGDVTPLPFYGVENTRDISFISNKPSVAQVDADGNVYAIKSGSATVTAWYNGESAKTTVKVLRSKEKASPNLVEAYIGNGTKNDQFKLDHKNKNDLTFSTNEMIEKVVTTAGDIAEYPKEEIYISGPFGTVSYNRYIENPAAGETNVRVGVGETKTLAVKGVAEGIVWKSSNKNYARVDALGRVTGIKGKENGEAAKVNVTAKIGKINLKYLITVDPEKEADADQNIVASEVRLSRDQVVSLSPGGRIIEKTAEDTEEDTNELSRSYNDIQESAGQINNKTLVSQMGLGFNLGCTFSETNASSPRLNIEKIRQRIDAVYNAGFKTIRIQCMWYPEMDEDGHISDRTGRLAILKETVDYCESKGLFVILGSADLGEGGTFHNSRWNLSDVLSEKFQKEFSNMWSDIAEMFKDNDYHIVFEAYNEPCQWKKAWYETNEYGYSNNSQAQDSWYFGGRHNNLKYILTVNRIFAEIMSEKAPDRCYMISSYNADPVSAYTNYWDITWQRAEDHRQLENSAWGQENWGKLYWKPLGLDMDKAIYFCHQYKYGDDFKNNMNTLKNTFKARGIDLPIYVDENGTHSRNFNDGTVNPVYLAPVEYMTQTMNSGLCLWDDTQSMSYLNYNDCSWINKNLIDAMIEAAGQEAPENYDQ